MTNLSFTFHCHFIKAWQSAVTGGGSGNKPNQHNKIMKLNKIIPALITTLAVAGLLTACETGHEKESEASLKAQAKISEADAKQAALAKVPNGTIKEGELEKEKGRLIWSFDIAIPDSKDIKEVAVDAITGAVISVDTETPEQQAKEKAEDAKKEKKEKD
jgi:hypothetical protein